MKRPNSHARRHSRSPSAHRISGARRRATRRAFALGLSLLTATAGILLPAIAHAAPTEYEIQGSWAPGTPNPVVSGNGLTSVWKYNINDAAPAPENPATPNVLITFVAANAKFTDIPLACLTEGVTPASQIEGGGTQLNCNLGTRNLGTAELLLTGVRTTGITGDSVAMSASIGTPGENAVSASLPELVIANTFAMDMQFDGGNPRSASTTDNTQALSFPWALRHAPGTTAGPNTVSYDLAFSSTSNEIVTPQTVGCSAQNLTNPTYPYSSAGHAADRTAPFPAVCTLTQTSPNKLRLTISGIDYSKATVPTTDSTGVALPTEWDVVAAGLINVKFTYTAANTITFVASSPTYTSLAGETSVDKPANNSNSRASTRGAWTGGWSLSSQRPAVDGSLWTDTYRTMAGQPALAVAGVRKPEGAETQTQTCSVLDTKFATFDSAALGSISGGVVTAYPGIAYEYFVGTGPGAILDHTNSAYNPNTFTCDATTGGTWRTTVPADRTTVKAVRATIPRAANIPSDIGRMYISTTIRPTTPVGQDVWVWTSYKMGASAWVNPHRSLNVTDKPLSGTLTPGSRYPYTGGGRDVLRIIAGQPSITKEVDQRVTLAGATVNYTLTYRVDAPADTTVNSLTLEDTLPAGLTYVPGSANPAPTEVNGQKVTWVLNGVSTNTDYTILLSATISPSATAGATYTNRASVELAGITRSDTAMTRVRDGGYTFLTKTADAQQIPHINGTAQDSWTVRITSADTSPQTFTDTIDILPYNGDGRGTHYTGSYSLAGPVVALPGSTVYYTSANPATLAFDPADASHGTPGNPSGNTAGWTTTFTPQATAVRVIGPALAPGGQQEFRISVITTDATFGDTYVNRADARASRTELVMRTSGWFQIAAVNSVTLKKYVQASDGTWHDAQNIDDYPSLHNGDSARYRLVVTNTGDQTLTSVGLSDDRIDLAGLTPLPTGLTSGAHIAVLEPGAENAVTIEYEVLLTGHSAGGTVVNNACATPEDTTLTASCDPAGVTILPSSLSWEKTDTASPAHHLGGSEWELVRVDTEQNPIAPAVVIHDCISADPTGCTGIDIDPRAGKFLVNPLDDGNYRITETRAPAGYLLDDTPRYVTVLGPTSLPVPITNEQAPALHIPLTGGVGASSFLAGATLAGGLALLLVALQRRRCRTSTPRP